MQKLEVKRISMGPVGEYLIWLSTGERILYFPDDVAETHQVDRLSFSEV